MSLRAPQGQGVHGRGVAGQRLPQGAALAQVPQPHRARVSAAGQMRRKAVRRAGVDGDGVQESLVAAQGPAQRTTALRVPQPYGAVGAGRGEPVPAALARGRRHRHHPQAVTGPLPQRGRAVQIPQPDRLVVPAAQQQVPAVGGGARGQGADREEMALQDVRQGLPGTRVPQTDAVVLASGRHQYAALAAVGPGQRGRRPAGVDPGDLVPRDDVPDLDVGAVAGEREPGRKTGVPRLRQQQRPARRRRLGRRTGGGQRPLQDLPVPQAQRAVAGGRREDPGIRRGDGAERGHRGGVPAEQPRRLLGGGVPPGDVPYGDAAARPGREEVAFAQDEAGQAAHRPTGAGEGRERSAGAPDGDAPVRVAGRDRPRPRGRSEDAYVGRELEPRHLRLGRRVPEHQERTVGDRQQRPAGRLLHRRQRGGRRTRGVPRQGQQGQRAQPLVPPDHHPVPVDAEHRELVPAVAVRAHVGDPHPAGPVDLVDEVAGRRVPEADGAVRTAGH